MSNTIISFTTIPPRMDRISPTIESLLNQTADIAAIQLWIPKTYKRLGFNDYIAPKLPRGVEVMLCDEDFGPATKILPAARHFQGQDVRIIYCDDDEYYSPDWADTLIAGSDSHPEECMTVCGLNVANVRHESFLKSREYKLLNLATLDLFRRFYRSRNFGARPAVGLVDICQGFGGVLVKPRFFTPAAYEIPDVLWTVDDIWLSGQFGVNGIGIRKVSAEKKCHKTEAASVADLTSYTHEGYNRVATDLLCVDYFSKNHGIWRA